jgi:hypothetical protein
MCEMDSEGQTQALGGAHITQLAVLLGQIARFGSFSCLFQPHRLSIFTKGSGVASLRAHSPHRHRTGVPA